ncbi:hypothetical protein FQA39_LY07373 [Lamprigera yunnana]|nr:hypothetical protein FQA39_LY07373 [Lamprigera yunnana]
MNETYHFLYFHKGKYVHNTMLSRQSLFLKNTFTNATLQKCNYVNQICKDRYTGKVALVTASTQGIGYSIAKRLAQEGAKVIISSRKEANVNEATAKLTAEGLNVFGIVCHSAKQEDRTRILKKAEELGGIDILVLNAGVNPVPGPMFDDITIYCASKSALLNLTKGLACTLGPENITVNCLAPGYINTKFSKILLKNNNDPFECIPLRRIGEPEDVAGLVAFLASKDARYITGETIVIGGGLQSRL